LDQQSELSGAQSAELHPPELLLSIRHRTGPSIQQQSQPQSQHHVINYVITELEVPYLAARWGEGRKDD